jgi:hypothetical protein
MVARRSVSANRNGGHFMKHERRIVTAIALISSLSGCGLTSEPQEGDRGLPFGLSKFHWGMGPDEAAPLYAGL